jgi:pimeloyl-ACP methyl ester carboxylesterase
VGKPLIYLPPMPMTHVELEWRVGDLRAAYERTARNNIWVRYDGRGFGLSDRDAWDLSLDAMVRDLEAVVDALDLTRTSAGVEFHDRGEHALKGIAEPQRVFAVRKDGA